MQPARWDIALNKGTGFLLPLTWKDENGTPRNLSSGWTAKAQVRETEESSVLLEVTDADGITLGSGTENIQIRFTGSQTGGLSVERGVWGLTLTNDLDDEFPLLEGSVSVGLLVVR